MGFPKTGVKRHFFKALRATAAWLVTAGHAVVDPAKPKPGYITRFGARNSLVSEVLWRAANLRAAVEMFRARRPVLTTGQEFALPLKTRKR
jgi:hypothetical protein